MNIQLEKIDKNKYRTLSLISYNTIVVPKGFETDGASIPKLLRIVGTPFTGNYTRAAIVHDWLYSTHIMSKDEADTIFYNCMLEDGVSSLKAKSMYYSVKWFGYNAYNKDKSIINENRKLGQLPEIG